MIEEMREGHHRPDYLIVSVSSQEQAAFWRQRLGEEVIVVVEEWPGGAGNGLGTLYAFEEACRQGVNLMAVVEKGGSVFLYHTAGQGKRLAPLPLAEGGNKAAVKLPELIEIEGKRVPITLLEAVIRQTSIYAPTRGGRLSVFWSDQLFIPQLAPTPPTHEVEVMARFEPLPTKEEWAQRHLMSYGIFSADGQLMEKCGWEEARKILGSEMGVSLGSFSLSLLALQRLLMEFAPELASRSGQMDSDPHFWMPLTLDLPRYLQLMSRKGIETSRIKHQWGRMGVLRTNEVVGTADIGTGSYWWDFGTLRNYYTNLCKLTAEGEEADTLRAFFGYKRGGSSILINVEAEQVNLRKCVAISCSAPSLEGEEALFYGIESDEPIILKRGGVRADSVVPLQTTLDADGKADWEKKLPGNALSYAKVADRLMTPTRLP